MFSSACSSASSCSHPGWERRCSGTNYGWFSRWSSHDSWYLHITQTFHKNGWWMVIPHQDHLEAGPVRRSTVTKMVHDAHQVSKKVSKFKSTFSMKVFPIWRTQIRETVGKLQGCVLSNWYRYSVTPPNWSDVSCLGPVAGRWSRGRGRCDFCTGALNHFHFHRCTQPLSLS